MYSSSSDKKAACTLSVTVKSNLLTDCPQPESPSTMTAHTYEHKYRLASQFARRFQNEKRERAEKDTF